MIEVATVPACCGDYKANNGPKLALSASLELLVQSTPLSRRKVFYTADLHDGSRADIASTLAALGQRVILGGHKGTW